MNALVGSPSPVSTLPDEVLGSIMKLSLGEPEGVSPPSCLSTSSTPITLTHVSSSWRAVAISNPQLWSHLVISITSATPINSGGLRTILERSESLPLTVFLRVTPFSGYLEFGFQETHNILAISTLRSRLRTLRLCINRTMLRSMFDPRLPHHLEISHLAEEIQILLLPTSQDRMLNLSLGGTGDDEPASTILRHLSVVPATPAHLDRHMDFSSIHLAFDTTRLTHLNLRASQMTCASVLKLLGCSPNLYSLAVTLAGPGSYMAILLANIVLLGHGPSQNPLTHSKLQELDIEVYYQNTVTTLSALLEPLTTPMLSVLRIVSGFPYYPKALLDTENIGYLYRSPDLSTLQIMGTGMKDIRDALASCCSLQTLEVTACPRRFLKSCVPKENWSAVARESRCHVTMEDLEHIFARLEAICWDVVSSSADLSSIQVEMLIEDPELATKTYRRNICKGDAGTGVNNLRSVVLTLHLSSTADCSLAKAGAERVHSLNLHSELEREAPELRSESDSHDSDDSSLFSEDVGESNPELEDVEKDSDAEDRALFADSDGESIPALVEVPDREADRDDRRLFSFCDSDSEGMPEI